MCLRRFFGLAPALNALVLCLTAAVDSRAADPQSVSDIGALSVLTAEHVVKAAGLIKSGKIYSLAVVTGPDTPAYPGRRYQILTDQILVSGEHTYGSNRLSGFDDYLSAWLGVGTQIDGFAHVSVNGEHFRGVPSDAVIQPRGAIRYGIETVPPIVGRGVLLDMAARQNLTMLEGGTAIGEAEIKAALTQQGLRLASGDVVLLHTGWMQQADRDPERFIQTEPGLTLAGARFLADHGVVAIGADTWALDVIPAEDPAEFLPVHGFLLAQRGIHILENINTAELAADSAYEFFFVLAAPRLAGAVQAPVHPIAIR